MSSVIPKGQLSAFQRWEMTSFGEKHPAPSDKIEVDPAKTEVSIAELEQIRESARLEAYAAAYKDGYAHGMDQGKQDGYAAAEDEVKGNIRILQELTENFSQQLVGAGQQVRQEVFDLALDLSEAMLKINLELKPESILAIVQDAIEQLPSVQAPAQMLLHPLDAAIVKEQVGESLSQAGWRIVSDHHIERGGCKLETAHNLVDATYATRWQRLSQAIKKSEQEDSA